MGRTAAAEALVGLEQVIAEYREDVVLAAYTRLLKLLTSGTCYEDWECACKIGHMLKEMGLV